MLLIFNKFIIKISFFYFYPLKLTLFMSTSNSSSFLYVVKVLCLMEIKEIMVN